MQGELDELEREEFFRLKKVQKNKQKAVAAQDAENSARLANKVCVFVCHVPITLYFMPGFFLSRVL